MFGVFGVEGMRSVLLWHGHRQFGRGFEESSLRTLGRVPCWFRPSYTNSER